MANILAVGIAALDIINTTDGFPQEDEEVRALSQEIRRGGNSSNTLTVLSQLNHHCHWLGSLANDSAAKMITDDFKIYGIEFAGCEIHPGHTTPTSYITLNKLNGSRTIVHYRDLPEMSAGNFKKCSLGQFDWIHFEGRNVEQTREMLAYLKETNVRSIVSIEIEKDRKNLQDLYTGADIYFFSKAFAANNNHSDPENFLRHYRTLIPDALLVCTWGSEGAYALEKHELMFSAAPAIKAIDTVGAGDTCNAGFIHAQLSGKSIIDSLAFACELAAKKCAMQGFKGLV